MRLFKDGIGGVDLIYRGSEVPSLRYDSPPIYIDDEVDGAEFVRFNNVKNTIYISKEFPAYSGPVDLYLVIRKMQSVDYEAFMGTHLGFKNYGNHLAITRNLVEQKFPAKSGVLDFNKTSIVRIQYNGDSSRVWINNQAYANGNMVSLANTPLKQLQYSTISHVFSHDFYGMWIKFGLLNQTENDSVFNLLAQKFNYGRYPNHPVAENIKIVRNDVAKSWSVQFDYRHGGQIAEDKSRRKYQWYYMPSEWDLQSRTAIDGANDSVLIRADYPEIFTQPYPSNKYFYCEIALFEEGNASDLPWHYFHSYFMTDNEL